MATQDRTHHQDYIARIRYSNTLPPPPNPPKLLDIPNAGLANGVYTSTTFANKLAREQPLNIEADAELGMPINLVGLPGVFQGDESGKYDVVPTWTALTSHAVLYGLDQPPPPHPHDKPLLRSLAMLGKATAITSGVSFLRRTEYIAADSGQAKFDSKIKDRARQEILKRKRTELEDENDPKRILRAVTRGFDLANPGDAAEHEPRSKADTLAWEQPRHPLDPDLHVLDTYPVLPDPDALTDSGFYILTKFVTNPSANVDSYDPRLDVGILRPVAPDKEVADLQHDLEQAYKADNTNPKPPLPRYNYEYFLPAHTSSIPAIKTKFDDHNAHKDDTSLYDSENKESGTHYFKYQRIRGYETYQQTGQGDDFYGESVAMALHDGGATSRLAKGAYFYPIRQRTTIRPRRKPGMGVGHLSQMPETDKVDSIEVMVRDPEETELLAMKNHRDALFGTEEEGQEQEQPEQPEQMEEEEG